MLGLLLPILLSALSPGDDGWKPTAAELARAHEMLAGSWQFLSISDKGEILGPRLVETRFARDGMLTIADRQINIVNPVTGEKRTATFRIDPSKSLRRIDLFTRDDRILRGIYKFEDDSLTLCLQPDETRKVPADFSSPESSDLILIRLKTVAALSASAGKATSNGEARPATRPTKRATARTGSRPGPQRGGASPRPRTAGGDLGHSLDDRRRRSTGPGPRSSKVRPERPCTDWHAKPGHRLAQGGERRLSAIRIDPSKTPSEVDVTTQFDEVLKGIYRFNGDKLTVCLAKRDDDERPTAFEAPTGSSDLLFVLKMATAHRWRPHLRRHRHTLRPAPGPIPNPSCRPPPIRTSTSGRGSSAPGRSTTHRAV